jgi:phosphatidylglycerol:prolipoprotein diacylglycerol transferase
MYPKLFEIPYVHLPVWSYGVMLVVGFLSAIALIRRLSRDITPDPEMITSAALYTLVAGIIGARIFYVVHYWDRFSDRPLDILVIWKGGLELLGGVILAVTVNIIYLRFHKLPVRKYLDILAIGLLLALSFGRIGCFLRGCCFGEPTDVPWAVRFPYGSDAYRSQVSANPARNREKPQLELPADFFEYHNKSGVFYQQLKPYESLTDEQQQLVTNGPYRCLPVHPTQLYSSGIALVCALVLYLFWRRSRNAEKSEMGRSFLTKPGSTFALMFILYGFVRFFIEFLRDDNPYEIDSLTISQLISVALVIFGAALMAVFQKLTLKHPAKKY